MTRAGCSGGLSELLQPVEYLLLRWPLEPVEIQRSLQPQRAFVPLQTIDLSHFLNFAPHVRDWCVTVQRRRHNQHRLRRNERQHFIEVERKAGLVADENPQARLQSVEVRVMPDAFNSLLRRGQPQSVETAHGGQRFRPPVEGCRQQSDLGAQRVAHQENAG